MSTSLPALTCILAFDACNRLAVRSLGSKYGLPFSGTDLTMATERLQGAFETHSAVRLAFSADAGGRAYEACLTQVVGPSLDAEVVFVPIETLEAAPDKLAPSLAAMLAGLTPHLIDIPYLHLGENDFIYKFRPERDRNPAVYAEDPTSNALYQSQLCAAIKEISRQHERLATAPVDLNFGIVRYVLPSHFGFCLGVKNAIERAYETLAANPGRRVFMLSELIHNPFVNADLLRRGLRYLQTDKGVPYTTSGAPATAPNDSLAWDHLTSDDIVIIPAFGATNEDKARLVRKGIAVYHHDATCMLVEKVWKAARAYGREGYTVLIHGKAEHEETKATFSNTRRHARALILRNLQEAHQFGELLQRRHDTGVQAEFERIFAGKYGPELQIGRDFERIAVVNQTTLLMNETLGIVDYLRCLYSNLLGDPDRVGGSTRRDTLCYATQVNQDALARALEGEIDAAFVIGGRNSSNTYQLYRVCAQQLGPKAFFIQHEDAINSLDEVEHFVFPSDGGSGHTEKRSLWPDENRERPRRILVTGGASCPDGLIQQVINRLNQFFPSDQLRLPADVLADLASFAT